MLDAKGKLINPEVRIETTNACNARCIICPREKMTRPIVTMPYSHFKKLVEQADKLGAFTISPFGYGEPLLDQELPDKIRLCTDMGFDTFITTNASLLTPKISCALLKAGLTHIRFSVHGFLKRNYEMIQRNLSFVETMFNILKFLSINRNRFGGCCKTSVTTIPLFEHGDIESIKSFWLPKVDHLEIWRPHNWAGKRTYRRHTSRPKIKSCLRPFSGPVQIQADGTVIPCCFLTNSEFVLGNTYSKTIREILWDYPYQWLRDMHRKRKPCYPCMNCDQYYESDIIPLLFSSRDPGRETGRTSSTKFKLVAN